MGVCLSKVDRSSVPLGKKQLLFNVRVWHYLVKYYSGTAGTDCNAKLALLYVPSSFLQSVDDKYLVCNFYLALK